VLELLLEPRNCHLGRGRRDDHPGEAPGTRLSQGPVDQHPALLDVAVEHGGRVLRLLEESSKGSAVPVVPADPGWTGVKPIDRYSGSSISVDCGEAVRAPRR
jgi:hypothetical protein